MLRFFKSLLGGKKVKEPAPEAPYKVEAPVVTETVSIPVEGAGTVEVPVKPKKAPAKPKAEKKTAAMKAPAKPRAKKAAK